jgi:hypothetical protein
MCSDTLNVGAMLQTTAAVGSVESNEALTVVDANRRKLIIADEALVSAQAAAPAEIGALVARMLLGSQDGAFIAGDVQPLLQRGQTSVLHLRHGDPVPPIGEMTDVVSCFASETPRELKKRKGWPRLRAHRLVTVYPRHLIGEITLSWAGSLTIRLLSGVDDVSIRVRPWSVSSAGDALRQYGYPLR